MPGAEPRAEGPSSRLAEDGHWKGIRVMIHWWCPCLGWGWTSCVFSRGNLRAAACGSGQHWVLPFIKTDRLHSTETRQHQRHICTDTSKNLITEKTNLLLKNTMSWTAGAFPTLWAVESCSERGWSFLEKGRRRQIGVARHMLTAALLRGPTAQRIGKTGRVQKNGYHSMTQQATTKTTWMIN